MEHDRQRPQVLSAFRNPRTHLILILEQLRLLGSPLDPPSSVNMNVKQHTKDHTSSSDNSGRVRRLRPTDRPTDRRRERRHRPQRRRFYLVPLPS